jgi:VWFA-related protein
VVKALSALILAPLLYAQTTATQPPGEVNSQDAGITFQSKVNVVLVPVVVRNKAGKTVDGLTKEDFQLFDKGKLQSISRVAIEKGEGKSEAAPEAKPKPTPAAGASPSTDTYTSDVATPTHFTAWFFDDIHVSVGDLLVARQAAEKFLAKGLRDTDRAAIYTTSGQTTVEFTDSIEKLREGFASLRPRPVSRTSTQECPDVSYYMGDLIVNKNDSIALNVAADDAMVCANLQTRPQAIAMARSAAMRSLNEGQHETRLALGSLQDVVRRMSAMPGQRLIVMISPGFLRLADELRDESDIMDRAIKANVTISALDARGLYTDTPDITKNYTSANAVRMQQQYAREASRASSDVMAELADATGGTFFQNSNDITGGMKELSTPPEVYYVLAFSPQNLKLDGSYHSLKVTVRSQALSAKARRGYYAPRHLTDADEEAKAEVSDALFSRQEMRDIPIAIHTEFFKPTDNEAQLSVNTRIDVRKLRFRKADGRNNDNILVVAGLFDYNGNFLQAVSKKIDMRLKDDTLASKLNGGIGVQADFKVAPGRYVLRLVVRDSEGQTMAAQTGGVEIP